MSMILFGVSGEMVYELSVCEPGLGSDNAHLNNLSTSSPVLTRPEIATAPYPWSRAGAG